MMNSAKKTELREAFGKRLQRVRRHKKLSQEALADIMHIHFMSVSRWERGVSSPSIDQLIFISRYLQVTTDYLLGLGDEDFEFTMDLTDDFL